MALAMALLTMALLTFPHVRTIGEVYAYAAIMGVVGGMITTLFLTRYLMPVLYSFYGHRELVGERGV